MTRSRVRIALGIVAALVLLTVLSAIPRSTKTGYVARQAYYQLELLYGRVPLAEVAEHRDLTAAERQRLEWIPQIQAYARQLGLEVDGHYTTINPTWDRTIWNVSAAHPLRFQTVKWWFPIVGRVPYLGFFSEDDADRRMTGLTEQGYDTYKRTAGAYSTLGWFNDPVLPGMLQWSESRLSNTLFHELAHVTLWIPGSVKFNESFASFVGDVSAEAYLVDKYGADSPEVDLERDRVHDRRIFRLLMTDLYRELDTVYTDDVLDDATKHERKARIIASLPDRVQRSDLHQQERYHTNVIASPWNNARIGQFRTYNKSPEHFDRLLDQVGGDLPAFFERIDEITRGADDPYKALALAVGAEWEDDEDDGN